MRGARERFSFSLCSPLRSPFSQALKCRNISSEPVNKERLALVEERLFIKSKEDWYDVPRSHIQLVDPKLFREHQTVGSLLAHYYPDHKWQRSFIRHHAGATRAPQIFAARVLRSIFPPDVKIEFNSRGGHGLIGAVGNSLEIDLFLPDYKLGFEYQDPHHYFHSRYGRDTLEEYQQRDKQKQKQATEQGITIINIPFWWDWNVDSLVATILDKRKDLESIITRPLSSTAEIMSEIPPPHIAAKYNTDIPGLGSPMLALHITTRSFNPTDMLIFEKYDGIRAIWNGIARTMYSRWGRPIHVPLYFCDSIPNNLWLDGEMWFGREKGARYQAVKLSKVSPELVKWHEMRYMAFDSPMPNLRSLPYLDRYTFLKRVITDDGGFVKLVPYEVCTSRDFAETKYYAIRNQGGEGIILRDPDSPYVSGYSKHLYKSKGFYDAEAVVMKQLSPNSFLCRVNKHVIYSSTKVKHPNHNKERFGYYELEMKVDESFDGEIEDIEAGQTIVSFKYVGKYNGNGPPMNPTDIHNEGQHYTNPARRVSDPMWRPNLQRRWLTKESRKNFLLGFARVKQFDPYFSENWYSVTHADVVKRGGRGLLAHYGNSHINAIMDLFPDIGLEETKFIHLKSNYWSDVNNRKKFFDDFAKSRGFDPLVKDNWKSVYHKDVINSKGGRGVLEYYNGSLSTALVDLYQGSTGIDAQFLKTKNTRKEGMKEEEKTRIAKQFFDQFSKSENFDPLIPEYWYIITKSSAIKKGGKSVLSLFSGSLSEALLNAYPDIGLKVKKLNSSSQGYWTRREHRKKFMDKYITDNTIASRNWDSVSKEHILALKGGIEFMHYYKGSITEAMQDLYPKY